MSTDSLLTLLGIFAAVYSVLGPQQRLDLGVRVGAWTWTLVGSTMLLLHYLSFGCGSFATTTCLFTCNGTSTGHK